MSRALRIATAVPGVLFFISGLQWLFAPGNAAESLGMPLLDGVGRSTQIGDMGAFFFGISALILLGTLRLERHWLLAAAFFVGAAAVVRTVAWAVHGADFAFAFIGVEVVVTVLLAYSASTLHSQGKP